MAEMASESSAVPQDEMMTDIAPDTAQDSKQDEVMEGVDDTLPEQVVRAHGITSEDLSIMRGIVDQLTVYKDENGYETAQHFQRVLNRRLIPEYFEVIKEPIAFSTIRSKLLRKQYTAWKEFVRDFALISHNAQVYNRPSAPVYSDAVALRELVKMELAKLVDKKIIDEEDVELPDLGEIPPVDPSPPPESNDEESEEEEDDDEVESDEDQPVTRTVKGKSGSRRGRPPINREGSKITDSKDSEEHKVRGRPPKVLTPMEARINTLLKGLRKFKNTNGELKILPFEKLPDKQAMPEYYRDIKNPIAIDLIKRKAKRKKYQSVDAALKDLELLFDNAKAYNRDDSQVYKDAVELQKEARVLAEQEKKKPDSDFAIEDGKIPLSEILHKGELWKVGDWVHISNPNDLAKPIVAQIYRTWQDPDGQKWVNACWYYRPEQTVHRFEKHFFENEVVKTGRYQDHQIDEIVDRCFVMFVTRYNKGRPRGFPADKEVYVCEARYNEEKFKLNKIKTWASCVPDEVREKDYEMNLFDAPRKMKKVPSPIKHLLREDAKEDDPLPKPTWGPANAPPIVGAVHKRPREANESPPPEPTPTPPPPAAMESRSNPRPYDNQGDAIMSNNQARPTTASSTTQPPAPYGQQFGASRVSASPAPPALTTQTSYGSQPGAQHAPAPPTPQHYAPAQAYSASYPSATPQVSTPNPLTGPTGYNSRPAYTAPRAIPPPVAQPYQAGGSNAYNPPKNPPEVYTLPDATNTLIPEDMRSQFQRDDEGRVIFFTTPPVDLGNSLVPNEPKSTLGNSLRYKARVIRDNLEKKKAAAKRAEDIANHAKNCRQMEEDWKNASEEDQGEMIFLLASLWAQKIDEGTIEWYKRTYGPGWEEIQKEDDLKTAKRQLEAKREREAMEATAAERAERLAKRTKLESKRGFPYD